MARIAGVDLPKGKQVEIALTYIFGIGRSSARDIVSKAGVDPSRRTDDLADQDITTIRDIIEDQYKVEGDMSLLMRMGTLFGTSR